LETLQKEILLDAKREANAILAEAEEERRRILAEANKERESVLTTAREGIARVIDAERNERVTSARLNAKRVVNDAKSKVVDQVVEAVWTAFKETRNRPAYAKQLEALVNQGLKEFGGKGVVHLNALDLKSEVAKKYKAKLTKEPLQAAGGAIVASEDGRIRVDYTLEQLFAEKRESVRKAVYTELFVGGNK